MKRLPFAVAMLAFCAGCPGNLKKPNSQLTYPYVATSQREAQIRAGKARIKKGMPPDVVRGVLGEPDEVRDLFPKNISKGAKPIGYTWWYLVQRKTDVGSVEDRDEKLLRVSFNLAHKVAKVDVWGLEATAKHVEKRGAKRRLLQREFTVVVNAKFLFPHGWGNAYRCTVIAVKAGTAPDQTFVLSAYVGLLRYPGRSFRSLTMQFSQRPDLKYGPPPGFRDKKGRYWELISLKKQ